MLQGIFGRRGIPVSKWALSYKEELSHDEGPISQVLVGKGEPQHSPRKRCFQSPEKWEEKKEFCSISRAPTEHRKIRCGWDPVLPPSRWIKGWYPTVLLQHPFGMLNPTPATFHLLQGDGAILWPRMRVLFPTPKTDPFSQNRVISYTERPDGKAQMSC